MKTINTEKALTIALLALKFVISDDTLRLRFLDLTGLDGDGLRSAARSTLTAVAVLDFLLGHEPDLLAFCDAEDLDPSLPYACQRVLSGSSDEMGSL